MSDTWGWFIDIENENENKNENYKKILKYNLLNKIPETIYEENEYYQIKNVPKNDFQYDTYFKTETEEILSARIEPVTIIMLLLFMSGYILITI